MSTTTIPKSKAKTAYGLLSEIRKFILDEPKRYDQHHWLIRRDIEAPSEFDFPECGTTACIGGWVATLKKPDAIRSRWSVEPIAADILGLDGDQAFELFSEFAVAGEPQTKNHARRGARHVAKFQKKYAKQLKAKRV